MALSTSPTQFPSFNIRKRLEVSKHLGMDTEKRLQQYQVYDDNVYQRRVVHRFSMGDVDDVEIYIAGPIYDWQQTDHGKWVMTHGRDPQYHVNADPVTYGYQVMITAHITPKRWTEYVLRGWYTG